MLLGIPNNKYTVRNLYRGHESLLQSWCFSVHIFLLPTALIPRERNWQLHRGHQPVALPLVIILDSIKQSTTWPPPSWRSPRDPGHHCQYWVDVQDPWDVLLEWHHFWKCCLADLWIRKVISVRIWDSGFWEIFYLWYWISQIYKTYLFPIS